MGENSKIEWTDHTFNAWWGCSHVHPGCANCYAEAWAKRFGVKWGPRGIRRVATEATWKEPLKWNRAAAKAGVRAKVFCASMADVFEDWSGPMLDTKGNTVHRGEAWGLDELTAIPGVRIGKSVASMSDVRRRLFNLIDSTPWLDWLLLTKRPENIRRMWPVQTHGFRPNVGNDRLNVWLGTSISDQASADKQIPELLKCRDLSPVLFLSAEPLLGQVDLGLSTATCKCCERRSSRWITLHRTIWGCIPGSKLQALPGTYRAESNQHGALSVRTASGELLGVMPNEMNVLGPIDWVIAGGEDGPRPMHPDWARSIRDQCVTAGVPFFFKQFGSWAPVEIAGAHTHALLRDGTETAFSMPDEKDPDISQLFKDGWRAISQLPEDAVGVCRVGKKIAGRLLDGREWNEFPVVHHA